MCNYYCYRCILLLAARASRQTISSCCARYKYLVLLFLSWSVMSSNAPTAATAATMAANTTPRNLTPPDSNNSSFNNNSFDNPLLNPAAYSPTSPHAQVFQGPHFHPATRQIRPPKSPLYVPAVLRPTERPVNKRPLTPPRSMHSSTDSLSGAKPLARPHTPAQPIMIITALTRSSTASSGPTTPTALQSTRAHWKPDSDATHCDAAGCSLAFSFLSRRHHCRKCGLIFCSSHANQQVPLNEDAEFSEIGGWQRACDSCFGDWVSYNQELITKKIGNEDEDQDTAATQAIPAGGKAGQAKKGPQQDAASVPRDWSWSTF